MVPLCGAMPLRCHAEVLAIATPVSNPAMFVDKREQQVATAGVDGVEIGSRVGLAKARDRSRGGSYVGTDDSGAKLIATVAGVVVGAGLVGPVVSHAAVSGTAGFPERSDRRSRSHRLTAAVVPEMPTETAGPCRRRETTSRPGMRLEYWLSLRWPRAASGLAHENCNSNSCPVP